MKKSDTKAGEMTQSVRAVQSVLGTRVQPSRNPLGTRKGRLPKAVLQLLHPYHSKQMHTSSTNKQTDVKNCVFMHKIQMLLGHGASVHRHRQTLRIRTQGDKISWEGDTSESCDVR